MRHPIYSGSRDRRAGFAVLFSSWWSLGASVLLVVFFHFKAVREEGWLVEHYPGYPEYMRAVRRRLIPWLTLIRSKASSARSSSSTVNAADIWIRSRAVPFGTTG